MSAYTDAGSTNEGWAWTYNISSQKYTLKLENAKIEVANGLGIRFPAPTTKIVIDILLSGENTVSGGGSGGGDYELCGIYAPANQIFDITVMGSGSLNVSSNPSTPITHNYGKAICIENGSLAINDVNVTAVGSIFAYTDIGITNSNVTVESFNDNSPLQCNSNMTIEDSTIVSTVNNQRVGASDDNSRAVQAGEAMTIKNSNVTAKGGAYGVSAAEALIIEKGGLTANGHTWNGINGKSVSIKGSTIDATGKRCGITALNGVIDIQESEITAEAQVIAAVYATRQNNTDPAIILGDRLAIEDAGKIGTTEFPDSSGYTTTSFIDMDDEYLEKNASYVPTNVLRNVTVYTTADYSAVDEAIANIPSDLNMYTADSVSALNDAKNAVVRGKNITEQSTVNDYATAIENAINALVYKEADYSKVDTAIAKIPADQSIYTSASVGVLNNAKNSVVRGKNITEQSVVDGYATAIEDAIDALEYKDADYTKVDEAIAKAQALNADHYKDFSAVTSAISKVVRGKNITEQNVVDGYATAIENAITALTYKGADYSKVDAAIAKIPTDLSIYTDASVKAVNHAKNAVVRDKNITEQATVNGYATAIENAITSLKKKTVSSISDDSTGTKVEYEDGTLFDTDIVLSVTSKPQAEMDKLKDNVEKAAPGLLLGGLYDVKLLKDGVAIQPDGKIKISFPLTDKMKSMTNLQIVYIDDNGNITIIPSEVKDGMITFITDHFSNYGIIGKVKAADPGNNNGGGNNNNNDNGNANSPQTGDSSPVLLFVLMILASGTALIVLTQKRRVFKHLKK